MPSKVVFWIVGGLLLFWEFLCFFVALVLSADPNPSYYGKYMGWEFFRAAFLFMQAPLVGIGTAFVVLKCIDFLPGDVNLQKNHGFPDTDFSTTEWIDYIKDNFLIDLYVRVALIGGTLGWMAVVCVVFT